jgi:nucleoside-diphosphate-sugar epimerase
LKPTETSVIFGGTGFIGTHLAQYLLREGLSVRVVLADTRPPRDEPYSAELQAALGRGAAEYVAVDVRRPIAASTLPSHADLVFNLAAVHREPGHQPREYFETNIYGAENVCAWATAAGCTRMVFTSSISPYGPSEEMKDEYSLPVPESPYGSSKLAAEKIHLAWQAANLERKLLILRPGVVFGPGEGGNVTRLVRSLTRGYFVYMGNRKTRKAGGYVKELCRVASFGLGHLEDSAAPVALFNFGFDPTPTLESFVDAIRSVTGIRRRPISVPRFALMGVSYPIDFAARTVGIRQPVSPVRVRKLFRSTWIEPRRLRELGYEWKFDLESAFADWKKDSPRDFVN